MDEKNGSIEELEHRRGSYSKPIPDEKLVDKYSLAVSRGEKNPGAVRSVVETNVLRKR